MSKHLLLSLNRLSCGTWCRPTLTCDRELQVNEGGLGSASQAA